MDRRRRIIYERNEEEGEESSKQQENRSPNRGVFRSKPYKRVCIGAVDLFENSQQIEISRLGLI